VFKTRCFTVGITTNNSSNKAGFSKSLDAPAPLMFQGWRD